MFKFVRGCRRVPCVVAPGIDVLGRWLRGGAGWARNGSGARAIHVPCVIPSGIQPVGDSWRCRYFRLHLSCSAADAERPAGPARPRRSGRVPRQRQVATTWKGMQNASLCRSGPGGWRRLSLAGGRYHAVTDAGSGSRPARRSLPLGHSAAGSPGPGVGTPGEHLADRSHDGYQPARRAARPRGRSRRWCKRPSDRAELAQSRRWRCDGQEASVDTQNRPGMDTAKPAS